MSYSNAWDDTTPSVGGNFGAFDGGSSGAVGFRRLKVDIRERIDANYKIGTVVSFSGDYIPDGWKSCDGSSLLRTEYAELFAEIGTTYGASDSSHFNLPDLRGYFLRGWDHGAGVDESASSRAVPTTTGATMTAGDHVGTIQQDNAGAHLHTYYDLADPGAITSAHTYRLLDFDSTRTGAATPSRGMVGLETRPINIYENLIIKCTPVSSVSAHMRVWDENTPAGTEAAAYGSRRWMEMMSSVEERLEIAYPIGIMMWWTSETVPYGWLECDGAAVDRTTYAELFAQIGEQFGSGDGLTTFNLPDCRGYFSRCVDDGAGVDEYSGSRTARGDGYYGDAVGTTQDDMLESHTHGLYTFGSSYNGWEIISWFVWPGSYYFWNGWGISTENQGSNVGHETRPVNITLKKIIRAAGI